MKPADPCDRGHRESPWEMWRLRELKRANEILKRAASFLGRSSIVNTRIVELICTVLRSAGVSVAPGTYYAAKTRAPSIRACRDAVMAPVLKQLWEDNNRVYGSRKLCKAARRAVHDIGRDQVARLMCTAGIAGARRSKRVRTTKPEFGASRHLDLVGRDFTATTPNQFSVTDLTLVPTWAGVTYGCHLTDAYSRMIVGGRVVQESTARENNGWMARKKSLTAGTDVAEEILGAAASLFYERGYDATSIRDLALVAGISSSTLYHHFTNKQEILHAVVERFMRDFNAELIPILIDPNRPHTQRLAEMTRRHLTMSDERRPELLNANQFRTSLSPTQLRNIVGLQWEYHDAVKALLAEGCAAGVFVVDDVDATTMALLDMLNGVREWFNHTGHLSINDVVNRYTRIVQRMVAATPSDNQ
jgi:AcrR family transcriptional regulator